MNAHEENNFSLKGFFSKVLSVQLVAHLVAR